MIADSPAPAAALVAALIAVALPSCDWLEPQPIAELPEPIVPADPPHPVPRPQSTIAVPETYEQLDLLYALQERALELEIEIAERNEEYATTGFQNFLTLDPYTLPSEQVFFLKHFCDSGDLTLPRDAQVLLLERELIRRREEGLPSMLPTAAEHSSLLGRLDDTISRYEQWIADLEKVAALYREIGSEATILYDEGVSPESLEAECRYVVKRQFEIGQELDALDEKIGSLRQALSEFE